MQFAPVVSLGMAQQLEAAGLYGSYHLLLAHQVLADPSGWRDLFTSIRAKRIVMVIMDNSLIELGESLNESALLEAVQIVEANTLVLPDKSHDLPETIHMSLGAAKRLQDKMPPYCKFMAVAQGSTFSEYLLCAEILNKIEGLGALSIPRNAAVLMRSRYELVKEVYRRTRRPLHLLGFSDHLDDDILSARLGPAYGVIGIDSAAPIRQGMAGQVYNWSTYKNCPPRKPDYLDVHPTFLDPMVKENVTWVRSQLG